jgi:hypothetical protein
VGWANQSCLPVGASTAMPSNDLTIFEGFSPSRHITGEGTVLYISAVVHPRPSGSALVVLDKERWARSANSSNPVIHCIL